MLKLALKPGDSITIGEEISVTLEEKTGSIARLLIDAPLEYNIKRHKGEAEAGKIYIVRNK